MDQYLVQKDDKIVEWSEKKLRRKLRERDLSGLELARHADDEDWQPLHDLPIFREEVPFVGDPRIAAQRQVTKSFGWHLIIYLAVTSYFFGVLSIPGMIWGLFVLGHASKALPATWSLIRSGNLLSGGGEAKALPPKGESKEAPSLPAAERAALPAAKGFDADMSEVRALLARRDEGDAGPTIAALDRMAETVHELRDKIRRLSALVDEDELRELIAQRDAAQASLATATDPEDRQLRQRQIEVLGDRLGADERARKTLERLKIRQSLAEQQVRQLRVDLVRAEARDGGRDDFGGRLEQIRLEVEAAEEVEDLLHNR
ncbi:MAG: hypothetical protein AAF799_47690 [Myxococcota bacterium]